MSKAIWLAIATGLCWGVGEVCTKSVLKSGQVGPITAIAARSAIALPVLVLAYVLVVHWMRVEPQAPWKADGSVLWKLVLGSGLMAGAAGMLCFYSALSLGEISRVKPIAFTIAPATGVLLGWLLLGETMSPRKAVAIGLILLGVALLTVGAGSHGARATGSDGGVTRAVK